MGPPEVPSPAYYPNHPASTRDAAQGTLSRNSDGCWGQFCKP